MAKESYAARIARLMSQGFTRSQARGHPLKAKSKAVNGKTVVVRSAEKSVAETRKALRESGISNQFLVETYGGRYTGIDAIGYHNAEFVNDDNNIALNNTIAFAKALPRGTTTNIKMHGFQIRSKHSPRGKSNTDQFGEFSWHFFENTTPGYVHRIEGRIRRDANYYYDMVNTDAEFYVAWKYKK